MLVVLFELLFYLFIIIYSAWYQNKQQYKQEQLTSGTCLELTKFT